MNMKKFVPRMPPLRIYMIKVKVICHIIASGLVQIYGACTGELYNKIAARKIEKEIFNPIVLERIEQIEDKWKYCEWNSDWNFPNASFESRYLRG